MAWRCFPARVGRRSPDDALVDHTGRRRSDRAARSVLRGNRAPHGADGRPSLADFTASTLFPATLASPDVGSTARQTIDTVVVFPAQNQRPVPVGTPNAAHWTDSTAEPPKNRGGYIFRRSETTRPSRSADLMSRTSGGRVRVVARRHVPQHGDGVTHGGGKAHPAAAASAALPPPARLPQSGSRLRPSTGRRPAASPAPVSAATRARSARRRRASRSRAPWRPASSPRRAGAGARRSLKTTIPSKSMMWKKAKITAAQLLG